VKAYFDSAVLIKLYVAEPNSAEAARWVQKYKSLLVFTPLQELEVRNAIRLKAARKEITDDELRKALRHIKADFDAGFLERPALDWPQVWQKAEELSARYGRESHSRPLDTLHVAMACCLGLGDFVTFDLRQAALAKKAGLRVKP
jgi:predicted nucleic acid-binding protein